MTPEEMRAAGRLATLALGDSVSHVEQVHLAVAARAFALTGPFSRPVRLVHDRVATSVYGVVRGAGRVAGTAAGDLAGAVAGSERPVGSTPRSNLALAMLNAAWGDELVRQGNDLAIPMAVRHARSDVALRADALGTAFPNATSKLAVFVHGLSETEESWSRHADRHGAAGQSTYGSRLALDFGFTPVYLRYNTGLRISDNGRRLAGLLEDLVASWAVPVTESILVGHSMGGLVARSACHYGQRSDHSWVSTIRHVFYLGSPHLGAGLERWVSSLTAVLDKLDEGRPLASVINRRSAGIKDLRSGFFLDDDWRGAGTETKSRRSDLPLVSTANHYAVSAAITTSRRNPLGRVVGDLLVQPASARGRSRRGRHIPFRVEHTRHFPGLHHFALLNHPRIYEAMREWLGLPSDGHPRGRPEDLAVEDLAG